MSETAVRTESLDKIFGGLRAVDGVSLDVAVGERRGLLGPNGAGKTTLFHCITGNIRPTAGNVFLFGVDVTALPEHARTALGMGRTFQISNVFTDLTLLENVELALLGTDRRRWTLHRRVAGMKDLRQEALRQLEDVGLADRAQDSVGALSYGERRQLELALALSSKPRVLFLDEPCAGLSPGERQRISRMISEFPRSMTVVMIEHDMDIVLSLVDRVSVLHNGRVILEGPPNDVKNDRQVREVYFGRA